LFLISLCFSRLRSLSPHVVFLPSFFPLFPHILSIFSAFWSILPSCLPPILPALPFLSPLYQSWILFNPPCFLPSFSFIPLTHHPFPSPHTRSSLLGSPALPTSFTRFIPFASYKLLFSTSIAFFSLFSYVPHSFVVSSNLTYAFFLSSSHFYCNVYFFSFDCVLSYSGTRLRNYGCRGHRSNRCGIVLVAAQSSMRWLTWPGRGPPQVVHRHRILPLPGKRSISISIHIPSAVIRNEFFPPLACTRGGRSPNKLARCIALGNSFLRFRFQNAIGRRQQSLPLPGMLINHGHFLGDLNQNVQPSCHRASDLRTNKIQKLCQQKLLDSPRRSPDRVIPSRCFSSSNAGRLAHSGSLYSLRRSPLASVAKGRFFNSCAAPPQPKTRASQFAQIAQTSPAESTKPSAAFRFR